MKTFRLGSYLRVLLLQRRLRSFTGKNILDVGCNYGELTGMLAQNNTVVGIDTDREALTRAGRNVSTATFRYGSATDIPYPTGSFDVVLCCSVLEHIKDDTRCLGEIRRVVKENGELILTVPNHHFTLIPSWLEKGIAFINRIFHTSFPKTTNQYVHFGTEGIGHVRQGYDVRTLSRMLANEQFSITASGTYWHAPSRFGYMFLTPLMKSYYIPIPLARRIFRVFYFLDRFFPDDKGDLYVFARRLRNF